MMFCLYTEESGGLPGGGSILGVKMNKELWLEFGFVNYDGWEDVCWYNEGRASEFPLFSKETY